MTETERNQHNQQIETLYALYQQASSQRDVLMAQQTQQIEAWKQRSKEAKTGWQGLTDDDVHELTKDVIAFKSDVVAFVRKAEAMLKEKNGG
jgi:hypothetical protein